MKRPASPHKGVAVYHSRKISAGRNSQLLFKKNTQAALSESQCLDVLPKEPSNQDQSRNGADELRTGHHMAKQGRTCDLLDHSRPTEDEDGGKELLVEVHVAPIPPEGGKDAAK